ncbi:hypothetical protein GYMLUDRAFT_825532 [Collybiopsis luxurians FD-317 M1]|uniref:Uncharacterized protein n=1 Tax=Collybiopsis luxurians FD-317 M1 TaxID=944289 RepID=A0A0D0C1B7_9AGAR|nr:hypothetical protein GYMLUDRAFT_825532 [Collybiopsis luxurians FD-317 M1]
MIDMQRRVKRFISQREPDRTYSNVLCCYLLFVIYPQMNKTMYDVLPSFEYTIQFFSVRIG